MDGVGRDTVGTHFRVGIFLVFRRVGVGAWLGHALQ